MQIALGLPDLRDQSSLPVLNSAGGYLSCKTTPSRIRLPITAPVLDLIRRAIDRLVHPNKVMLWAISCAAFFGFFHLGKLLPETAKSFRPATDLLWGDIAMDNPSNP